MIHIRQFLQQQFFFVIGQGFCIEWNTKCRFDRRERENRKPNSRKGKKPI